MNQEKFVNLTKSGESYTVEYKTCTENVSESVYETICSFLNHSGGCILLGVKDNGEIKGINPDKAEKFKKNIINNIQNSELFLPCPYFSPQILNVDGKTVMALEIPCGQYVYKYKGHYFDRNGEADIDVSNQPELLLALFERKNPHLFEERFTDYLEMKHLDNHTFQYCKNILSVIKTNHYWLLMTNEEILLSSHLAKRDDDTGCLKLKNAALILFGTEDALTEFMPRYRFEALFHLCTYQQYNDLTQFPNRYDDRVTLHCNLINVYDRLSKFVERYLPDRFYLPEGSLHREDLRWKLFREIVANLCVHSDYSSGYACFLHIFKDRVITKNPTRLLPEIPEGELKISQLQNYTKNPLLVRIFRELAWVEDMGSGTRNITKYAPMYFPEYKVEINSGSQFIFSVTYNEMSETNVHNSPENVHNNSKMSMTDTENVHNSPENVHNSPENVHNSLENVHNSLENVHNSPENVHNSPEMSETDFDIVRGKKDGKKNKRQQAIIGLIKKNPAISLDTIAEILDVNKKTIWRDISELKENGVLERIGGSRFGGEWVIVN
ncbi:MAG: putative DNA binding domain-containing protein [Bacteroidales bacterium]|nr:putative DNA binding domain-containing protein [Bacteroidales bacterium]